MYVKIPQEPLFKIMNAVPYEDEKEHPWQLYLQQFNLQF